MISSGNLENDPILQGNILASDSGINANSQRVSKKIYFSFHYNVCIFFIKVSSFLILYKNSNPVATPGRNIHYCSVVLGWKHLI